MSPDLTSNPSLAATVRAILMDSFATVGESDRIDSLPFSRSPLSRVLLYMVDLYHLLFALRLPNELEF